MIINEEIELDRKEQIWTNYERRNTLDQKKYLLQNFIYLS